MKVKKLKVYPVSFVFFRRTDCPFILDGHFQRVERFDSMVCALKLVVVHFTMECSGSIQTTIGETLTTGKFPGEPDECNNAKM